MDQGNDFLIFSSSIKKKYLFQLVHFYGLWQALIQEIIQYIIQYMLHKWSLMMVTVKQKKHMKMR